VTLLSPDYDVPRVNLWDSIGKKYHLDSTTACKPLYDDLRKSLTALAPTH
jgi:hypothetical protein